MQRQVAINDEQTSDAQRRRGAAKQMAMRLLLDMSAAAGAAN